MSQLTPDPKTAMVDDMDFTFVNGIFMPLTLAAGDTIEYPTPETIVIHLSSKPSVSDHTIMLPAEDVTIYTKNILTIQHRTRAVTELTIEQKMEWQKTLAEAGATTKH